MKKTKKEILHSEKNKKHRFVVGYIGEKQCVYDFFKDVDIVGRTFINPLTLNQAKRALKKLAEPDEPMAIYEIIPVETFNI